MVAMIGGLPGNVPPEEEEADGFGVDMTDARAALEQAKSLTNKAYDAKAQMLREARSGQTGMERLRGALLAAAVPGRNKSNWDTLRQGLTAYNESGVATRNAEEKQRLGLMGLEADRNLSLAELEAKYGPKAKGGNRKVGVNQVTGEYYLTDVEEGAGNVTTLGRPQAPVGDSGVQVRTVTGPDGRKIQIVETPGPYGRPNVEVLKPEPKTPEEMAEIAASIVTAQTRASEDEQVRAGARKTLPVALRTADMALKGVDELLKHPGLSAVVGLPNPFQGGLGPLGEMRGSPAAGFKTRLEQLSNGAFLEAYNLLKGGGAITNIEGDKAEKAIIRASTAQSEEEFSAAMNDFRNAIVSGIRLLREQAGGASDASRFEGAAAAAPAKPQGAPRPIPANLLEQYRKVPAGNRPEARKRFEAAGYDVSGLR